MSVSHTSGLCRSLRVDFRIVSSFFCIHSCDENVQVIPDHPFQQQGSSLPTIVELLIIRFSLTFSSFTWPFLAHIPCSLPPQESLQEYYISFLVLSSHHIAIADMRINDLVFPVPPWRAAFLFHLFRPSSWHGSNACPFSTQKCSYSILPLICSLNDSNCATICQSTATTPATGWGDCQE